MGLAGPGSLYHTLPSLKKRDSSYQVSIMKIVICFAVGWDPLTDKPNPAKMLFDRARILHEAVGGSDFFKKVLTGDGK